MQPNQNMPASVRSGRVRSDRVQQAVNELVMAEMFLVQATLESASAIGDGFNELGKQISEGEVSGEESWESISSTLQRIADNALEPYTTRYRYFRDMVSKDS